MKTVRVIAPMGAVVRPPATLRLSDEQYAARAGQTGTRGDKGICDLQGEVQFKLGEVFGIENPEGRLNLALFEVLEDDKPAPRKTAARRTSGASVKSSEGQ